MKNDRAAAFRAAMDYIATPPRPEKRIFLTYRAIDGYSARRSFVTLRGARRWAAERVGEHPDIGSSYAVSFDGVGTISVSGATLAELFPPR